MQDFTPAATLAINTQEQRDALLYACDELVRLEEGSLAEGEDRGYADLPLTRTAIEDYEGLRDRLKAEGSLCAIPGRLVSLVREALCEQLGYLDLSGGEDTPDDLRWGHAVLDLLAGLVPASA